MKKKKLLTLSAAILFCIGIVIAGSTVFSNEDISYTEPSVEEQEKLFYIGKWTLHYDENNRLIRREYLPYYSEEKPEYESKYEYGSENV